MYRLSFATLAATLFATAALAVEPVPGAMLGTADSEIAAALGDDGYALHYVEREHGKIEVKATKDGRRYEIKIDAKTGKVYAVELDD